MTIGVSRDSSGDRLALASSKLTTQKTSNASGLDCLPDLELDLNIPATRDQSWDKAVPRTVSLLVPGVDMDTPTDMVGQPNVVTKKEEVLRDLEDKKHQIREAKGLLGELNKKLHFYVSAWIQNGLMTVVGVGVMAYLQTLDSMGP